MKEPAHNFKRRREDFINDDKIHSLYVDDNSDTVIYDHFGWLGSGLFDKNGREIFQGDRVCYDGRTDEIHTVTFGDGGFWLDYIPLSEYVGDSLEVVGHIAEENNEDTNAQS